jgi:ABC-type transport system substrate-binding protein
MKRQTLAKAVMTGIMAILFVVPTLAGAAEQGKKKQVPVLETSKITMGSEAIKQEVIQVLRKGEMAKVTLNIAGQPGVNFKVEYSTTGAEDSYAQVPKGAGVIGSNGLGTVRFDLRKLGKEEVYVKVTTSDSADFANPRTTPKPLVLAVENVSIRDRGWFENGIAKARREVSEHLHIKPERQPASVLGVRG